MIVQAQQVKRGILVFVAIAGGLVFTLWNPGWILSNENRHNATSNPVRSKEEAAAREELSTFGKARLEAAELAYQAHYKGMKYGRSTDLLYQLSIRWLHAELDLATDRKQRVGAYGSHLLRMKTWEEVNLENSIALDDPYLLMIVSFRREAEYWLAREKL